MSNKEFNWIIVSPQVSRLLKNIKNYIEKDWTNYYFFLRENTLTIKVWFSSRFCLI